MEIDFRFHSSDTRSATISTYLWPALREGVQGPCVQKGVVITWPGNGEKMEKNGIKLRSWTIKDNKVWQKINHKTVRLDDHHILVSMSIIVDCSRIVIKDCNKRTIMKLLHYGDQSALWQSDQSEARLISLVSDGEWWNGSWQEERR